MVIGGRSPTQKLQSDLIFLIIYFSFGLHLNLKITREDLGERNKRLEIHRIHSSPTLKLLKQKLNPPEIKSGLVDHMCFQTEDLKIEFQFRKCFVE